MDSPSFFIRLAHKIWICFIQKKSARRTHKILYVHMLCVRGLLEATTRPYYQVPPSCCFVAGENKHLIEQHYVDRTSYTANQVSPLLSPTVVNRTGSSRFNVGFSEFMNWVWVMKKFALFSDWSFIRCVLHHCAWVSVLKRFLTKMICTLLLEVDGFIPAQVDGRVA